MKTKEPLPRQQPHKLTYAKERKPQNGPILSGYAGPVPARRYRNHHATDAPALIAPLTTIAADINVGLGNALFIRGEGEGLSWDKGVPLHCSSDSTWIWASADVTEKVVFKLLLNDVLWAQGDNLVVSAGKDLRTVPVF